MNKNYYKKVSVLGMLILGLSGCAKDPETVLSIKRPVPVSMKTIVNDPIIKADPTTPPRNPKPTIPVYKPKK